MSDQDEYRTQDNQEYTTQDNQEYTTQEDTTQEDMNNQEYIDAYIVLFSMLAIMTFLMSLSSFVAEKNKEIEKKDYSVSYNSALMGLLFTIIVVLIYVLNKFKILY
jgi:heme/copper-type cytochrome/quinol oxidase subunit 3